MFITQNRQTKRALDYVWMTEPSAQTKVPNEIYEINNDEQSYN